MPDPGNSYNLRSWRLYKLPPETPIAAREAQLLIDDIIATIEGYKLSVGGILVPNTKGQLLTHNGTSPSLLNIGTNGRIPVADDTLTNGFDWKDPSVLGFMTALLVRDNDADIGSQTAINFIDGGGITWTITDDGANGEVEITASVTFPTTIVRVPVVVNAASFAAPAQNATYYFGGIPSRVPATTITREQQVCPVTGTITAVFLQGTWGNTPTGNNHTFNVRINNTTDALITNTQPISGASPVFISNTAMSQAVTAGDLLAIKWQTPATWTTPVTNIIWNGMIVIEY